MYMQAFSCVLGINCYNPAFDVTPADLITGGIITEHGVFPAGKLYDELKLRTVVS